MKFRKKPVVIEAIQWDGSVEAHLEIEKWVGDGIQADFTKPNIPIIISTLEGDMTGKLGDYIIRGNKGEVYPCKPDIFEQTYEKADSDKPKIVCLCGSSRFVAEMAILAWNFEKEGWIALGLHLLPVGYKNEIKDHLAEAEGVAAQMDELHRRKIDLADMVFVVNRGGYIGKSTASEIEYARQHEKIIKYLE